MTMQEKIDELNAVRAQIQLLNDRASVLVSSIKDDVSRLGLGDASPMTRNGKQHGTLGYGGAKRAFEAFVRSQAGTFKPTDVSKATGIASASVWTRLAAAEKEGTIVRVGKGLFALRPGWLSGQGGEGVMTRKEEAAQPWHVTGEAG